jgi:hypothetical protein
MNNQPPPDARRRCGGHPPAYARWPRTGPWRGRSRASTGYSPLSAAGSAWWRHSLRPSETQSDSNSAHHDFCPMYGPAPRFSASQPESIGRDEVPANRHVLTTDRSVAFPVDSWGSWRVMDVAGPPRPFRSLRKSHNRTASSPRRWGTRAGRSSCRVSGHRASRARSIDEFPGSRSGGDHGISPDLRSEVRPAPAGERSPGLHTQLARVSDSQSVDCSSQCSSASASSRRIAATIGSASQSRALASACSR